MAVSLKPIRLTGHATQQLVRRGTSEAEVVEAIRTEVWKPAERGRLECSKLHAFNATWNRQQYASKQVQPIFVDEPDEIVVVTVYYF